MLSIGKIFSLPKYLQMPSVGIDISDKSIKYVELKKADCGYRLKNFGEKKTEAGIIESGIIKNEEKFISKLVELKKETGNIYTVFSLPEEKAFLKVIKLPAMDKSKIRQSLELQLEETIPLSAKDAQFDYEIVEADEENRLTVVLTAFPKKIINQYADCLKRAGFFPVACEVENQSIARAIVPKDHKGPFLIVDFGRTRTSFLIASDGIARFTSTVSVSGESLSQSLARAFKINIFEAERMKHLQVLSGRTDEKVLSAIVPIISTIKDEIYNVLSFWENQNSKKENEIKKIILCGGDANMEGLTDFFSQNTKRPVVLGNPWVNVTSFKNYIPEIKRNISLTYVTAIGLALRAIEHKQL
jgi:type IV pilus assembly protein PilM